MWQHCVKNIDIYNTAWGCLFHEHVVNKKLATNEKFVFSFTLSFVEDCDDCN